MNTVELQRRSHADGLLYDTVQDIFQGPVKWLIENQQKTSVDTDFFMQLTINRALIGNVVAIEGVAMNEEAAPESCSQIRLQSLTALSRLKQNIETHAEIIAEQPASFQLHIKKINQSIATIARILPALGDDAVKIFDPVLNSGSAERSA